MASALADSSPSDQPIRPPVAALACTGCGRIHRLTELAPGETASCTRCGRLLAKGTRFGTDTALAFAVSGLLFAIPAFALPFVTVSKLSAAHTGVFFSSVSGLWSEGMRLLSIWVFICGALAPLLLLATLLTALAPIRLGRRKTAPRLLAPVVNAIEQWSMPEVYVLAVLVALTKLHTLVGVSIELGFWCYIVMALFTLLAWRNFDVAAASPQRAVDFHPA